MMKNEENHEIKLTFKCLHCKFFSVFIPTFFGEDRDHRKAYYLRMTIKHEKTYFYVLMEEGIE